MNDITNITPGAGLTMSSLEIAGLTGKAHRNITRDIKKMLDALKSEHVAFQATYVDGKGEVRESYNLPRHETMVLVTGYSIPIKETLRTLTPEQEAVLTAWNAAEDIYAAADAKYHAWCCSLPRGVSSSTATDQTIRAAWIDADTEKWQARHAMMRLFRKPSTT